MNFFYGQSLHKICLLNSHNLPRGQADGGLYPLIWEYGKQDELSFQGIQVAGLLGFTINCHIILLYHNKTINPQLKLDNPLNPRSDYLIPDRVYESEMIPMALKHFLPG